MLSTILACISHSSPFHFLRVKGLMTLKLTCKDLCDELENEARDSLWQLVIEFELAGFELEESLCSRSARPKFLKLLPSLLTARFGARCAADGFSGLLSVQENQQPWIRLAGMRECQRLAKLLGTQTADTEYVDSGSAYKTLVKICLLEPEQPGDITFGEPEALSLGGQRLVLHFAALGGQLLLALRDDSAHPGSISLLPAGHPVGPEKQLFTIDLSSLDQSKMLLHYRGVNLRLNGPWVRGVGLCNFGNTSGLKQDAYTPSWLRNAAPVDEKLQRQQGLLCLARLREGSSRMDSFMCSESIHLQLELPQNSAVLAGLGFTALLDWPTDWD
ncbi:unnamed protein product [Polarella glacialis]|uniref:Uncharacterized protein n=1 Tax=Polarella glacialis TaxID=89957 RepID=A0A813DTN0_POLGL|nr:unnamed protein product [Polarella glacialis]